MSFSHMEIKTVEKMFPQIDFDMSVCLGALECGRCMQACQPHVLRCYTAIPEGHTSTSKDWIPIATFPSLCTACMECVKACPNAEEGAIRVAFAPRTLPKKIHKRT